MARGNPNKRGRELEGFKSPRLFPYIARMASCWTHPAYGSLRAEMDLAKFGNSRAVAEMFSDGVVEQVAQRSKTSVEKNRVAEYGFQNNAPGNNFGTKLIQNRYVTH